MRGEAVGWSRYGRTVAAPDAPEMQSISAVTLFTTDMGRSVRFYRSLGFELRYGGTDASFSSLTVGSGYLNLMANAEPPAAAWGRIVFYTSDVDALYRRVLALGFDPQAPPRDAEWGERYFHLADPDGHELSFARPLER